MSDYSDPFCHTASIEIAAPTDVVLDVVSDGLRQGDWALGSQHRRAGDEEGVFIGISWFDGGETFVRPVPDKDRLYVHYEVGRSAADALQPRNVVRIVPGPVIGLAEDRCVATLMTWRDASASDDRWRMTCVSHKTEMYRIRHLAEARAKTDTKEEVKD